MMRLTQLTLFTRCHTTNPFSHTMKNKFITDNVAARKEDTDSATDKVQTGNKSYAKLKSKLGSSDLE